MVNARFYVSVGEVKRRDSSSNCFKITTQTCSQVNREEIEKKLTHDNTTRVNTLMFDQVLVGGHALIQCAREGCLRRQG